MSTCPWHVECPARPANVFRNNTIMAAWSSSGCLARHRVLTAWLCVRADGRCHACGTVAADALHVAACGQRGQRIFRQSTSPSPLLHHGTHIAPEGAPEQFFGSHQFAFVLQPGKLVAIDEGSLEPEFLPRAH